MLRWCTRAHLVCEKNLMAVVMLAWGIFSTTAFSAPTFALQSWRAENGLPQNSITAVAQSHDGYIWLGTYSGLARFDGVRFTVFNDSTTPELRSSRVSSLFEAKDGTLWIGHENGNVTRYQAGRFDALPVARWSRSKVLAFGADADNDIWVLNQDGLLTRLRDRFMLVPPPDDPRRSFAMARGKNGALWIEQNGKVSSLANGRLRPLNFGDGSADVHVQGIAGSQDGGLWILCDGRMRKWKDGEWAEDLGRAPWNVAAVQYLMETREGYLAAGTSDQGLYLVSTDGEVLRFCRTNGFPTDSITCLWQDHERNLWVGAGNGGLAVLRAANATTVAPPDQWQGRAILSVATSAEGALWVGTEGAGLYRSYQGHWTKFEEDSGLANRYVWSIVPDARGQIWVGTWGGGLFVLDGKRFNRVLSFEETGAPVTALLSSPDGGFWVGTGAGLLRYESGRAEWKARKPEIASPDVRAIAQTPDGTVWFGMSGGGLGSLQHEKLGQIRRAQGLSSDFVQCLYAEPDGTLWIGTLGGGLNRLKNGRFAGITTKEGLANNVICDIEDDHQGCFWISSQYGIMRVSKEELNRCADGQSETLHCVSYGVSDGLPTLECSGGFQPAGCQTADGRIWFPTSRGLVAIDPRIIRANLLPPPVVVESLSMDGQVVGDSTVLSSRPRIPPGHHQIEIQYTALSFVAPEKVQFRYRLKGLDDKWVDADTRRAANFGYLPHGKYLFQVTACNNDGVWNEQGAEVAFTVLPFFWQTLWFRALALAMIAAGAGETAWLASRWRMRQKLEELERQRAIEHERGRIAQDIHDDLGADLTRITMLSESARSELDDPRQAEADLSQIYDTARELTRAVDEIVWAINPEHDTLEGLVNYLEKFAHDFLEAAGIRCRLDMPLQFPAWPLMGEVRHNLFLAFKEALNNAVKHAAASEVRISLTINARAFEMRIEDNGHGFQPEPRPDQPAADSERIETGNGLTNMRQRLEEIGGHCEIRSAPGQGTTVVFEVLIQTQVGQTPPPEDDSIVGNDDFH